MYSTLIDTLARQVRAQPTASALIWRGAAISYAEFDARSTAGAMSLVHAGVVPGDRVMLHLANSAALALAYYACFKAGAVAAPVPKDASAAEIEQIAHDCGPVLGLVTPEHWPSATPSLRWITMDGDWPGEPVGVPLPAPGRDALAVILYTSGTTGRARGVMHTHRTLLGWLNARAITSYCRESVVVSLPLVHGYAFMTLISTLTMGGTVILLGGREPDAVLDAINQWGAMRAIANPAMAHELVEEQVRAPRRLASLRRISVSADMTPLPLQQRFAEIFGDRMRRTYGSTEVGSIAGEPAGAIAANSLGRPSPGVEVRIVDAGGRDAAIHEIGEIAARSASMAIGYWDDASATAQTFREGFFHSGDLGFRDEQGRLFFAGRSKELIIRAGRNIAPRQIEDVLRQHPAVADAAVWGIPHPVLGQSVAAWVVPRTAVSPQELRAFIRPHVAEHKCPDQIFLVRGLPMTATGKVNRRALVRPDA